LAKPETISVVEMIAPNRRSGSPISPKSIGSAAEHAQSLPNDCSVPESRARARASRLEQARRSESENVGVRLTG